MNNAAMAVTLTVDELEALVERAAERAIAAVADASVQPDVLTRAQAAELLQVTDHQVVVFVKKHGLPGARCGGEWRFRRRDILAWIERQKEGT